MSDLPLSECRCLREPCTAARKLADSDANPLARGFALARLFCCRVTFGLLSLIACIVFFGC